MGKHIFNIHVYDIGLGTVNYAEVLYLKISKGNFSYAHLLVKLIKYIRDISCNVELAQTY